MAWAPRFEARLSEAGSCDIKELRSLMQKNGYVVLRKWLTEETRADIRSAMMALQDESLSQLKAQGMVDDTLPGEPMEKRLARLVAANPALRAHVPTLYREQLHMEAFFDVFFAADLLDVMLSLTGAEEIRLFPNYTCRPKIPGSAAHTVPWHQDAGLSHDGKPNEHDEKARMDAFGVVGSYFRTINCWTSMVPATAETGCMQFAPGSHKLGLLKHTLVGKVVAEDGTEHAAAQTQGNQIYTTQIDPEEIEKYELDKHAVDIVTAPGDIVLFSNLLAHRAHPNTSQDTVRWSLDWRYQDASKPTLRPLQGHIARSFYDLDKEVQTAKEWTALSLS